LLAVRGNTKSFGFACERGQKRKPTAGKEKKERIRPWERIGKIGADADGA